jgi:hypothetical protein
MSRQPFPERAAGRLALAFPPGRAVTQSILSSFRGAAPVSGGTTGFAGSAASGAFIPTGSAILGESILMTVADRRAPLNLCMAPYQGAMQPG